MDSIVVYVHGCGEMDRPLWYRIVLETCSSSSSSSSPALVFKGKKRQKQTIFPDTVGDMECENHQVIHHPVAVLSSDYGFEGSWAVIGDDIYWAGGWFYDESDKLTVSNNLLKHNIRNDKEDEWEKVCTLTIPRRSPFITAVGGRKIAIVGGYDERDDAKDSNSDINDDRWKKFGEIYDLDKRTLHYLNNSDISSTFKPKDVSHFTTVVEDDPTQIVIYSLFDGSMLFLDASTGDIVKRCEPDPNFAIWSCESRSCESPDVPPGLEGCSYQSIESLHIAVGDSTPVFLNRTLYFFAPELRLYAYDLNLRKWFQSECLVHKLHLLPIQHLIASCLICLPNGNLLVIVSQVPGVFTMASFSVSRPVPTSTTLVVTVEHIQYFCPRGPFFFLSNAKAIRLNNTGSDIMEGIFTSATEA